MYESAILKREEGGEHPGGRPCLTYTHAEFFVASGKLSKKREMSLSFGIPKDKNTIAYFYTMSRDRDRCTNTKK